VKRAPDSHLSVGAHLTTERDAGTINFHREVLEAQARSPMARPAGKAGHAELQIGDSAVMLADDSTTRSSGVKTNGSRSGAAWCLKLPRT
jgi:PhnB protein